MTLSIDFNTPVIRIPGFESKYDFTGVSNSLVRIFDDYLEARILQQFHFWLWLKKGGAVLRGFKWIYKAIIKLMTEAIVGFSEYKVRKAIASLVKKGILVREQLHREHYGAVHAQAAYNRQYYYRINYDALVQFIKTQTQSTNIEVILPRHIQAENTETAGFVNTANPICECRKTIQIPLSKITVQTLPPLPPLGEIKRVSQQNLFLLTNLKAIAPNGLSKSKVFFNPLVKMPANLNQYHSLM